MPEVIGAAIEGTKTASKVQEAKPQTPSLEIGKLKETAEIVTSDKAEILEPDIDAIKNRTLASIIEENRSVNQLEALNESAESKEGNDANEGPKLRELNEDEKALLKDAGLTDSNIEKCLVDENDKIYLTCRNQGLENGRHPETNVLYVRKEIVIRGIVMEGVFPEFESVVSYKLPETLEKSAEKVQFDYLNRQLYQEILSNPELRSQFTDRQIEILSKGKNPPGFTWHHNEECGKMQLVSTEIHAKSAHTGGDSIWCGR